MEKFLKKYNELLNNLSHQDLIEGLTSYVKDLSSLQQEALFCHLKPKEIKENIKRDDDNTMSYLDKSIIFIENLGKDDLYIEKVYSPEMEDWQNEDEEYFFEDKKGIEKSLSKIFDFSESLIKEKKYDKALILYSKFKELEIPVYDEYSGFMNYPLVSYCSTSSFLKDVNRIGALGLYCIFSLPLNLELKVKKFTSYLLSPICKEVTLKDFLKVGMDGFDSLDQFLTSLLEQLFKSEGIKSLSWIEQSVPTLFLKQKVEEYDSVHPKLHRILIEKYIEEDRIEEAKQAAKIALNSLDSHLLERSKVASLLINILLYQQSLITKSKIVDYYFTLSAISLNEEVIDIVLERFISKENYINFFSLYRLIYNNEDYKKKAYNRIKYCEKVVKNVENNPEFESYDKDKAIKEFALFLLNPVESSLKVLITKLSKGGYEDVINCLLSLYCLSKENKEFCHPLLPDQEDIGFRVRLFSSINISLSWEDEKTLLKWLSLKVDQKISTILASNSSYHYTQGVRYVYVLDYILKQKSIKFSDTTVIEYYKNKYKDNNKFIEKLETF